MKLAIIKEFKKINWKNGLGFTEEMLIHPAGSDVNSGDFEYRISSAFVKGESEFSFFNGYRRLLILLNDAIKLKHTDIQNNTTSEIELSDFVPHFFSGDVHTSAIVQGDREVRDFNFIFLPDKFEVVADIFNGTMELTLELDKIYFVFSMDSKISINEKVILPGELGSITVDTKKMCQVVTSSRSILVELRKLSLK